RDVGVKLFVTELGSQQPGTADHVAVLYVGLKATLMKIRSRRLGSEGVQTEVIELLRIDRKREGRCLLGSQDKIELRIGIEALQFGVAFEWRKAVHRRTDESIFERLHNRDAVLHQGTGERQPRSGGLDSGYDAVAVAKSRDDILE